MILHTIEEIRSAVKTWRDAGETVGLVPTMGALHEGHLSLIRRSAAENDRTIVSVFLNPTQFTDEADFEKYPRTLESDGSLAAGAGADIVWAPSAGEMYPDGFAAQVEVPALAALTGGGDEQRHYRGVCTVVLKLFNIVRPDAAYFGEKDAQQLRIIRRMALDLNLTLDIKGCPTVRAEDGLALSSRNARLTPEQRAAAPVLYKALTTARTLIEQGERGAEVIRALIEETIAAEPLGALEYLHIVDSETLRPYTDPETPRQNNIVEAPAPQSIPAGATVLILLAVRFGDIKLIDNITAAVNLRINHP